MPVYRHYVRISDAGFNGATYESAPYQQTGLVWRAAATSTVGRWRPSALGRVNVISLVRVALSAVAPGDVVEILDTFGTVRLSEAASVAGSRPLWMFPDDELRIFAVGTRADILVEDLDDPELAEYFAALTIASSSSTSGPSPYDHVQDVPAVTWVVDHNRGIDLPKGPIVEVRATDGGIVLVESNPITPNTCTIGPFPVATAGTARLV